jgi:two-component system alkaline phosphatase synthesis response regulator PhoP
MANLSALVIEDESDIADLIRYHLEKAGIKARVALRGDEGLAQAQKDPPDVLVLDLMLPGLDGLEVCRRLKRDDRTAHVPILMVTAKGEESDVVTGLELGADDYVVKPFSPKVLIARIRAILRRKRMEVPQGTEPIRVRDLVIHPGRHEVLAAGKPLDLTFSEMRILQLLASRPGWVYTRDQIVTAIHGESYPVTDRAVDVLVVGLRRKLGPRASYIETVRGVGYRFRER